MLHYIGGLVGANTAVTSGAAIKLFRRNGWAGAWVNGIYTFQHFHARSHEVLANVGDPVEVQFGGPEGPILVFETGDVVVLPAGIGHCRVSAPEQLIIVGAYPLGQEDWDLKRDTEADHALALQEIPYVPLPRTDPLFGDHGPVLTHWNA